MRGVSQTHLLNIMEDSWPMIMLYIMTAGPAQWGLVQSSSSSTIPYKFVKIVYS